MILQSKLLGQFKGVRHGFGTRLGGTETRTASASCNLQSPRKADDPSFAYWRNQISPSAKKVVELDQVHGAEVLHAKGLPGSFPFASPSLQKGDGLYTSASKEILAIRTADCVPVLAVACENNVPVAIAAIHCGWRSTVAAILTELFRQTPNAPEQWFFALGPSINIDAFEVGAEVIGAVQASVRAVPPNATRAGVGPGKFHLDLRRIISQQLLELGVPAQQIEQVGGCTYENRAMFYSYRRDGHLAGRQLSGICMQGTTDE